MEAQVIIKNPTKRGDIMAVSYNAGRECTKLNKFFEEDEEEEDNSSEEE
ncbi:hypothetical protein ACFL6I_21825 [candidate division KSB1 bacterium]